MAKINKKPPNVKVKRRFYFPLRLFIVLLITVVQILLVIGLALFACYKIPYLYILAIVIETICVLKIISGDDNPDYKVPWLLFVLILPIAGFMLYFMLSSRKLSRSQTRRIKDLSKNGYTANDTSLENLKTENLTAYNQAVLLKKISGAKVFENTEISYFSSGESMIKSMLLDLEKAENFIFLEYFIIGGGSVWKSFLDVLIKKAQSGVLVKVLYDDLGSAKSLPASYPERLSCYGIETIPFSKIGGIMGREFNNRNHRKITVIDGVIGYTGGINLADEYANVVSPYGYFKDGGVRLYGDAVKGLTELFVFDYAINLKTTPNLDCQLYPSVSAINDGFIVPFGDGPKPLYTRNVSKTIIQSMLASAEKYVYISTPYLIIDNDLLSDIEQTSLRGVNVKIVVPHIPDKKAVFAVTRSYYDRLKSAGVEIYEYTPGFIHQKCYLVDGKYALVGTINLDYRSLVHHLENGVWIYRSSVLKDIEIDFNNILKKSIFIEKNPLKSNFFVNIFVKIARIFAPLF